MGRKIENFDQVLPPILEKSKSNCRFFFPTFSKKFPISQNISKFFFCAKCRLEGVLTLCLVGPMDIRIVSMISGFPQRNFKNRFFHQQFDRHEIFLKKNHPAQGGGFSIPNYLNMMKKNFQSCHQKIFRVHFFQKNYIFSH